MSNSLLPSPMSILIAVALLAFIGISLFIFLGYTLLYGSLPVLEGELNVDGLQDEVIIERDSMGVPTIKAGHRLDVAYATGFLHAQERFFQMDMLRRKSAGELSELLGAKTLELDKRARAHQFRKLASIILDQLSHDEITLLSKYVDGVNKGLEELDVRPFEYLILRAKPKKWKPEDTLLVMYSLYLELQDSTGWWDMCRGTMHEQLPESVYHFFADNSSSWDAPLDGSENMTYPIPEANAFSYLDHSPDISSATEFQEIFESVPGSNCWAVSGELTESGKAILANDMHLGLTIPNIWYQMKWIWTGPDEDQHFVRSYTLPGCPLAIVGSNHEFSWGFTNASIDQSDVIIVKSPQGKENVYIGTDGEEIAFREVNESIAVKGENPINHTFLSSDWGPVIRKKEGEEETSYYVLNWTPHYPGALNLKLSLFETANTVEEAMQLKGGISIPLLNLIVADSRGSIGWSLIGNYLTPKGEHDGHKPIELKMLDLGLKVSLQTCSDAPVVLNPKEGYLWSGNNRPLDAERMKFLGAGVFVNGARAKQIRKRLNESKEYTEESLYTIQVDDEALFFRRWQKLMIEVLRDNPELPRSGEAIKALQQWQGHASVESVGYHLLRRYRDIVAERLFRRILAPCYEKYEKFSYHSFDYEESLWMLVTVRPEYLADPSGGWNEELAACYMDLIQFFEIHWGKNFKLKSIAWKARNRLDVRHYLSMTFPRFIRIFDLARKPLSGDNNHMPRLASPRFGASQRMVVSPGHDENAIFQMPGGQSGHPLSKYYRKGHSFWLKGEIDKQRPEMIYSLKLKSSPKEI